jgi:hypothetical protein
MARRGVCRGAPPPQPHTRIRHEVSGSCPRFAARSEPDRAPLAPRKRDHRVVHPLPRSENTQESPCFRPTEFRPHPKPHMIPWFVSRRRELSMTIILLLPDRSTPRGQSIGANLARCHRRAARSAHPSMRQWPTWRPGGAGTHETPAVRAQPSQPPSGRQGAFRACSHPSYFGLALACSEWPVSSATSCSSPAAKGACHDD